jgi:hypothetical protein
MPANNGTQLVSTFQTGTGWTVDVTAANLSPNLSEKDFDPYINGGLNLLSNWNKVSQTQLQYVGSALPAATPVTIVRRTAIVRIQELVYGTKLNTVNYEGEINKIHQILNDLKVQPPTVLSPSLIDYTSYVPATWAANPLQAPTARAVKTAIDFALVNATLPNSATFSGTLGVTGLTTLGALTVNGTPNFAQQIQGAAGLNLTGGSLTVAAGNATITGNLSATGTLGAGNTTITGTLGVTGATVLANATNTLTNAPTTLTAVGTEMVNAGWVRRTIRPHIRVSAGGAQNINPNVETAITFTTEFSDVDNAFSSSTFTCPTGCGGVYLVDAAIYLAATCTLIEIYVRINGALARRFRGATLGANSYEFVSGCCAVPLSAGDTVTIGCFQSNTAVAGRTVTGDSALTITRQGNL